MKTTNILATAIICLLLSGCAAAGSSDSPPLMEISTASLTEAETAGTETCTNVFHNHGDILEEAKDGSSAREVIDGKSTENQKMD